jgi:hypothetical protein
VQNNKTNITTIIESLHNSYHLKYKEWCEQNVGYLMCNYGTKESLLERMINDGIDTIEKLELYQKEAEAKHEEFTKKKTMNGWWQAVLLCKEIKEILNNNNL